MTPTARLRTRSRVRPRVRGNERGVALVMAIMVLLVVVILATVIMQNLSTQRKISGHSMRASRALTTAEAGIVEATSRVRSGEITLAESSPASVAQIFLTGSGAKPTLGADSTSWATAQAPGSWLTYSTATRSTNALTIAFRRDSASGAIMRYDDTQSAPLNTATGLAVMQVTATGITGNDRATVRADVILQPLHPTLSGALSTGNNVTLSNSVAVCGYRHAGPTPFTDGVYGRMGSPTCQTDEVGRGDVPAVWTTGTVTNNGGLIYGLPSAKLETQGGFFDGPWEALGITQSVFTAHLASPTTAPPSYQGLVWMDDNSIMNDGTGSYSIANLSGEGVLYVDGNLTLTGIVAYRGLLWVEGNLTSTAGGAVVGGVVVRGRTGGPCTLNGGPAILYSLDAVNTAAAKGMRQLVTLT